MEEANKYYAPITRKIMETALKVSNTVDEACDIISNINSNFDVEFFKEFPSMFEKIIEGNVKIYGFTANDKGEFVSSTVIDNDTNIAALDCILTEEDLAKAFIDTFNDTLRLYDHEETCECEDCDCEENQEPIANPHPEMCTREYLQQLANEYDIDNILKILNKHGVVIPELTQMFLEEYMVGEQLIGITESQENCSGVFYDYEEINETNLTKEFDFIDTFDNIMGAYVATLKQNCGCTQCYCETCGDCEDEECDCSTQDNKKSDEIDVYERLENLECVVFDLVNDIEKLKEKAEVSNNSSET